jgi:hypothetical protein
LGHEVSPSRPLPEIKTCGGAVFPAEPNYGSV